MPEFEKWKLVIVETPKLADIAINVEHDLFTFDYRFTMTDRRTDVLLATGKVTVWDGKTASKKFAKTIIEKLKPGREAAKDSENKNEKNKAASE